MEFIIPDCLRWEWDHDVVFRVDITESALKHARCSHCGKQLCKDGTYEKTIKLPDGHGTITLILPRLCCRHQDCCYFKKNKTRYTVRILPDFLRLHSQEPVLDSLIQLCADNPRLRNFLKEQLKNHDICLRLFCRPGSELTEEHKFYRYRKMPQWCVTLLCRLQGSGRRRFLTQQSKESSLWMKPTELPLKLNAKAQSLLTKLVGHACALYENLFKCLNCLKAPSKAEDKETEALKELKKFFKIQ